MKKYFMRFSSACSDENVFNAVMSVLGIFAVCLAALVCAAQVGLKFLPLRNYLTNVDALDGAVLAGTQPIIDRGSVTLSLNDGKPSEDIEILVNGDVAMPFDEATKTVEVSVQSVIEVRNLSGSTVTVSVGEVSDNLEAVLNNECVTVDKSAVMCRVMFE